MDVPAVIGQSGLYLRLQEDSELMTAILQLRVNVERLASTVSASIPSFTDHSVRHMDSMWRLTDQILTPSEVSALSLGEVFVLVAGFYLHDIGMAYAATPEGLTRIQSSPVYTSMFDVMSASGLNSEESAARALSFAVRKLHANAAIELATGRVPGTDHYLFDAKSIRDTWGNTCGRVAASHHWSLETIEQELGAAGIVPFPNRQEGDLGFVASVLRLVDYAHINRDRASMIDRVYRPPFDRGSLIHWLAQEHIDGPQRAGNDLVYRAAQPLSDVDAWWLYYSMLTGLDSEIRAVKRYLDRRVTSQGRLSLQSVRGAGSPAEMSVYIPTSGFLPIEVNLRTGSIDRIVELLAGESLYGPDAMVPVRELIQNARDAVMLKAAVAGTEIDRAALTIPIKVSLRKESSGHFLEVKDWGVGMTMKVMTDYLIAIGSDYWTSQLYIDFPTAVSAGFRPAGKFGIGFLSVFMVGDEVNVESNRSGGERTQLRLHGVGRRGELRTVPPPSGSGTSVRIHLKDSVIESLRQLPELVRVYAPMLSHHLEVDVERVVTKIPKGWIFALEPNEFRPWVLNAIQTLTRTRTGRLRRDEVLWLAHFRRRGDVREELWPRDLPEFKDSNTRLVASFDGISLLSLRGISVQPISTPGFVGVIDVESAMPDVSRRQVLGADVNQVLSRAIQGTKTKIVAHLNSLANRGLLIDKLEFLNDCVSVYGQEVILESSVPWISQIKMPGELVLLSSAQLITKLTEGPSLFLAYDTGPWTAMKRWAATSPGAKEIAIVLDGTGMSGPRYYSGPEEKTGALAELWPEWDRAALFGTILGLVAEAWQVNLEELTKQEGWRQQGSSISGRFLRP